MALRQGNPTLFEEFVRTEVGTFIGFFRRLGAGPFEAEDLSQEVFLKLYRSSHTYEPRSAFGAYALRVARNAWIDRRRRHGARPERSGASRGRSAEGEDEFDPTLALPDPEAGPTERASAREEVERLRAALGSLSEAHATVFELAVIQELPYAEIADALSIPIGTVKSRVFHALRNLREVLEAQDRTPSAAPRAPE